jgi:hypothetical protein
MKYCQGPICHEYRTKDRIRGTKGDKSYQTRRRSNFWYGNNNFCNQRCLYDWVGKNIEHALDHFGRTTQPKKVLGDQAWYKDYKWNNNRMSNGPSHNHYLINDLLGQCIPITEQQYNDKNITQPNNLSQ